HTTLFRSSLKISATRESFNPDIPNDPSRLKIASFSIFDENGNKYFFDVKETTATTKGYRQYQMFPSSNPWENLNDGQGVIPIGQNNDEIVTAYHLTNVTPYSYSEPIIEFSYDEYSESFRDFNFIKSKLLSTNSSLSDESYYQHIKDKINSAESEGWSKMRTQFGSSKSYYFDLIRTTTKKLNSIKYNDKIFINFTYEQGRLDENYFGNPDLVKLSNIKISSADIRKIGLLPVRTNVKLLKQFKLNYVHGTSNDKKLLLKEVIEYKNAVSDELTKKYKLHYNSENNSLPLLYEDPWGYCTDVNPEMNDHTTNANYIKTFVLEKMEVPTGGCVIYNYEPHSYSYIGATALTDQISNIRKNEIGGGIRIKNIGFFDDKNVSKDYYKQNLTSPIPAKELSYQYDLPGQSLSSGSLSFSKPVFTYQRDYELFGDFAKRVSPSTYTTEYLQPNHSDYFKYEITTNYNNLHTLTTKRANVGYKNVTISELSNGKKVLTFTSPIDFAEENYTVTYPFIPSKNRDYKRGLLLNEKNYNSGNILVSEIINTYSYTESKVNTGIIPYYRSGHNCLKTVCQQSGWIRAGLINTNQINCHNGFSMIANQTDYFLPKVHCTDTAALMNYEIEKRVVGWAK